METHTVLRRAASGVAISLIASVVFAAPAPPDHRTDDAWLRQTLIAREAALTRAYNICNLHALRASLFAGTRVEMPEGQRLDLVIEARDRICGRQRRELFPDSLRVQAVGDHAALVTGVQRFCSLGAEPCGASGVEFARLWILGGGRWRIGWMRRSASTLEIRSQIMLGTVGIARLQGASASTCSATASHRLLPGRQFSAPEPWPVKG